MLYSVLFSIRLNMSGCFGGLLTYENEQKTFFLARSFKWSFPVLLAEILTFLSTAK